MAGGVGLAVAIVIAVLALIGAFQSLDLDAYDYAVRNLSRAESDPPPLLVTITEDDIRRQGRWPIDDATLAQAIELLAAAGAGAIGVDIVRDIPVPPGSERLAAVLQRAPRVVFVTKFGL